MTRFTLAIVLALAAAGCKKDAPTPAVTGSGSAGASAAPASKPAGWTTGANPMAKPRPSAISDEMIGGADKLVAAVTALAADLEAAKGDCARATVAMKTRFDEIAKVSGELEKLRAQTDADPAAKDWMRQTYTAKMEHSVNTVMSSSIACKDDAAFMETLRKFPLQKRKQPTP